MTPDEVAEIFASANAAHETVTSRHVCADIDRFDENIKSILVKLPQEQDGDEHGMLYLSQDPSKHGTTTGRTAFTKIGTLSACNDSVDSSNSCSEHKNVEALCKFILNDSKVEASAEHRAKKMLIATFDDTQTKKLKHPIKLCAEVKVANGQHAMSNMMTRVNLKNL